MTRVRFFFNVLKQVLMEFSDERITKKSASLAYHAIFSLSPLLLIIISAASLFYQKNDVENKIYLELHNVFGPDVSMQIQNFVTNTAITGKSSFALYIGLGIMFFGATSMFSDMQDSINQIFQVESSKKAWIQFVINKALSFLVILILGLVLFSTVIAGSLLIAFDQEIKNYISINSVVSKAGLILANNLLSFVISVLVFYVLYKVLPDTRIKARSAFMGALFSGILFYFAKYLLSIYISNSSYMSIFGSAGSLIVLLLWINYVAMIIFLGAKFTKAYDDGPKFKTNKS